MYLNRKKRVFCLCVITLISASLRAVEIKPGLGIATGSSSNVAKLNEGTSGTYYKLNPTLDMAFLPSDSLVLNLQATASLKHFFYNQICPMANENKEEMRSTLIWFSTEIF